MSDPSSDPSIDQEPHLRSERFEPDPSEVRADRILHAEAQRPAPEHERVDQSVWEEPGLSPELAGDVPPGEITYRAWFAKRLLETSTRKSWVITCCAALAAGPWAILGAFWGSGQTAFSAVTLIVFAPLVEETMKVAVPLYVLEKKPYLFHARLQIVVTVLAGALAFAAVENFLYLHVYFHQPSEALAHWRWSVNVSLHAGSSLVAGMGLMHVWKDASRRLGRPRLSLAYPYLLTAVIMHGAYNAFALVFDVAVHPF